jgi:Tol biopolymer transport system component
VRTLSLLLAFSPLLSAQTTSRVSVASSGVQADLASTQCAISSEGYWIAFQSSATNLVSGDTNGFDDVFLRDVYLGETTRASELPGVQANGANLNPAIADLGRYVAFESDASNLIVGDTNGARDVLLFGRQAGTMLRASVSTAGAQSNGASFLPSLSADGRYVAFESDATNLVANDTNAKRDIFVRDTFSSTTVRASVSSLGVQANGTSSACSISADGRWVTFQSTAANLVPGDTNAIADVFVHDLQMGTTVRASVAISGAQANGPSFAPTLSGDGRLVTFASEAANLVSGDTNAARDIFLHDLQSGVTTRISLSSTWLEANGASFHPMISPDGGSVAFHSLASNLVTGDTNNARDVFVRNLQAASTTRLSISTAGVEGNDTSWLPSTSANGVFVTFASLATNLVPGDTNRVWDIFLLSNNGPHIWYVDANAPFPGFGSPEYPFQTIQAGIDAPWVLSCSDDLLVLPGIYREAIDLYRNIPIRSLAGPQETILDATGLGRSAITRDFNYGACTSIEGLTIRGGTGNPWSGYAGGGLHMQEGGPVWFRNCIFAGNSASQGGAIYVIGPGTSLTLDHCTIVNNSSSWGLGGAIYCETNIWLASSILWANGATPIVLNNGSLSVTASNLQVQDPLFWLPQFDFHLKAGSPSIGSGSGGSDQGAFPFNPNYCPEPGSYCAAKVNSQGCVPRIGFSGSPSLSGPDDFKITAVEALFGKPGVLFWSGGWDSKPFLGGTLCVKAPIIRTASQTAASAPYSCSGSYSFHFSHAYMQQQLLGLGETYYAQWWSRDPGFAAPNNVGLTDALRFTICP